MSGNANGTDKSIVMVTGGSGLVGSAIKDFVTANPKDHEEWIFLSSKEGDLRDRKATEAVFDKYKPTHVIHLAAKVGGLFANMAQKVRLDIKIFSFHSPFFNKSHTMTERLKFKCLLIIYLFLSSHFLVLFWYYHI
jgi:GDP-L-fucose synthase